MESSNSKEKIVGFIAIIFILCLLVFFSFHLVSKNKEKKQNEAQYVVYENKDINIKLRGDYIEYISLGDKYIEKGIVAKDKKNNDLSDTVSTVYYKNGKQVVSVDTDSLGGYLVEYTVLYDDKYQKADKTVIVVDNKAPKISFPKKTEISSSEALNYDLKKDVKVTDDSNDVSLTLDGDLSSSPGDYIITYKAIDKSGNTKIKKRLIKVK